jgi:hypothetical protein
MDLFTVRRLEKILDGYIDVKIPPDVRSSIRLTYEWQEEQLTLHEERLDYDERKWQGVPIVQFRYEEGNWSVYAKSAGSGSWINVPFILPNIDFEQQLEQVEIDREGIFWIS